MDKKTQGTNKKFHKNIREMVASLLTMKKTNSKESKEIIKKINSLTIKEKLYQGLCQELNYIKQLNDYYSKYYSIVLDKRIESEKNQKKLNKFYENLKESMKDFFEFSDGVDDQKLNFKGDKEQIKNDSDKIIRMKKRQQVNLNKQLKEIIDNTNEKQTKIDSLLKKVKQLENQRNTQYNNLIISEKKDIQKIENIEKINKLLQKKLTDLHNQIYSTKITITDNQNDINLDCQTLHQEELNIKLKEKEIQNQNLIREVYNLKKQIEILKINQEKEITERCFNANTISTNYTRVNSPRDYIKIKYSSERRKQKGRNKLSINTSNKTNSFSSTNLHSSKPTLNNNK